jgi:aminoglycoside phosphotransferase (APT) family kinase protein
MPVKSVGSLAVRGPDPPMTFPAYLYVGPVDELEDQARAAGLSPKAVRRAAEIFNRAAATEWGNVRSVVVHGDLASKHVMVTDKIEAVLDFEHARAGDAAEDLAYWSYVERDNGSFEALVKGYDSADTRLMHRVELLRLRISLSYLAYHAPRGELVGDFAVWVGENLDVDLGTVGH